MLLLLISATKQDTDQLIFTLFINLLEKKQIHNLIETGVLNQLLVSIGLCWSI